MMQGINEWFLTIINNCKTWYCHFILFEATKAEIIEFCEEQDRQQAKKEAEETEWLADYIQQSEYVGDIEQTTERVGIVREWEVLTTDEEEQFQEEDESQEEDKYICPFCGTPWSHNGRCKPCDRAFGRD